MLSGGVPSPPCGMETPLGYRHIHTMTNEFRAHRVGWRHRTRTTNAGIKVNSLVPSPPCGMETPMTTIKSIVKTPGSEPTVWDGDCERHDNEEHGQKVPSPPCGMETKVINRAIIGRTTVPSPPCGMETYLWWFLTRYLRACSEPTVWDGDIRPHPKEDITALFRAHCVGWRLAYSFLGLSLFTNVPSPPCGMETRRRGT